MQTHFFPPPN